MDNNVPLSLCRDLHWVTDVQHALANDRLTLDVQPIVDTRSSAPAPRFELLLRLHNDNGDVVRPAAFMPALERYGRLAVQLDCWVVLSVLDWLRRDAGSRVDQCAVNLSTRSLQDSQFLRFLRRQLVAGGETVAAKLCFEIKETALRGQRASVLKFIRTLSRYGCQFTLDDFGNDWNSCRHLKQLPFELIKISGPLVRNICLDRVDYAIVKAIIEAGQLTGKRVIAAWVENEDTYRQLSAAGIDFAQGNYCGQPRPLRALRLH